MTEQTFLIIFTLIFAIPLVIMVIQIIYQIATSKIEKSQTAKMAELITLLFQKHIPIIICGDTSTNRLSTLSTMITHLPNAARAYIIGDIGTSQAGLTTTDFNMMDYISHIPINANTILSTLITKLNNSITDNMYYVALNQLNKHDESIWTAFHDICINKHITPITTIDVRNSILADVEWISHIKSKTPVYQPPSSYIIYETGTHKNKTRCRNITLVENGVYRTLIQNGKFEKDYKTKL